MNYSKSLLFLALLGAQITHTATDPLDKQQEKLIGFAVDLVNQSKQKVEITSINGFVQGLSDKDTLAPGERKAITIKAGTRFTANFIANKEVTTSEAAAKEAAIKATKKWWQLWKYGQVKPTSEEMITNSYLLTVEGQGKNAKISQITFADKPWLSWLFPFPVYASGVMVSIQNVGATMPIPAGEGSSTTIKFEGGTLPGGEG